MPQAAPPVAHAAITVGIDWGTTRRRCVALNAHAQVLARFDDDEGMLAAKGRFASSLAQLLQRVERLASQADIVLSGMVGSAQGWHEVPYVDTSVPLDALASHLFSVPDGPPGLRCRIVPGYRWRGDGAQVDVMRGEETQLLGAVALGHRDGSFVLPGTHSKWVRLRDGRIERLATYMTGELFSMLTQHGTLAALMQDALDDEPAFEQGLHAAAEGAVLSNALFGCRARVVAGDMPAAAARDYLSGLLIGAEWHDAQRRGEAGSVHVIGESALVRRHAQAARVFGGEVRALDPRAVHRAALIALSTRST
jgi:2-dehydro-3-deoxygalactonokinase